jgi:dTDP-glucose 4,6-dehydratase
MRESKLFSEGQKKAYVDIDETICFYEGKRIYEYAIPNMTNINKINNLKKQGWHITYYTARGGASKIDYTELTIQQLNKWGCEFDNLIVGFKEDRTLPTKPSYDLIVDDKAKRIEEL